MSGTVHRYRHVMAAPNLFVLLLTILPLAVLIAWVRQNYVDLPFWDQWDLVPVLKKAMRYELPWSDIWRQHNEWRYPLFFLFWVHLSQATGWNIGWEIAINIGLASATFLVMLVLVQRTLRLLGKTTTPLVFPAMSVLIFSITQWENWLNGYQMVLFANVLFAVSGISLLATPEPGRFRSVLAGACGVLATYTAPIGMVFWPLGLGLYLVSAKPSTRRLLWSGLWIGTAAVACSLYFIDYEKPPHHPSLAAAFIQPLDYLTYVLNFIGSPVYGSLQSWIAGSLGLGTIAWSLYVLRRQSVPWAALAPYVALAAYSIGSAFAIGIGRVGFGVAQAITSRYITISTPFWISAIVLLYLAVHHGGLRAGVSIRIRNVTMSLALLAITAAVIRASAISGVEAAVWMEYRLASVRQGILDGTADDALLERIYPRPNVVREHLEFLKENRLSIYREEE